jgi:ubiquinone/menaquinone biosynthesis C-methylase UbiE
MIELNPEKELYDNIYSKPSRFVEYGHSNHGKRYLNLLLEHQPKSWLDVGCGYNELIKEVRKNKFIEDSWGIDFSCPGADQNCDILELPFPDKRWDFITAFDVMEHLLPEQVPIGLKEMVRVSKRFAFTIAFKKAGMEIDGKNAHPTVWPAETWTEEIEKVGGVIWKQSMPRKGFFIGEWN